MNVLWWSLLLFCCSRHCWIFTLENAFLGRTTAKRLNDLKDLMVWMQSNAVTMKPANELELDKSGKIQRVAQQQGLTVSSQQMGNSYKLL